MAEQPKQSALLRYPFVRPLNTPSRMAFERAAIEDARLRYFYNLAVNVTGDVEFARAITAIAAREGGLYGAVGDRGRSFGPLQFHVRGQLPYFAKWAKMPVPQAMEFVRQPQNWGKVIEYAWHDYLGRAYREGKEKGLSGPDLAAYMSQYGQRSIKPELSAQKYVELFMPFYLAAGTTPVSSGEGIPPYPFLRPVQGAPVGFTSLPSALPSTTPLPSEEPRPFAPPEPSQAQPQPQSRIGQVWAELTKPEPPVSGWPALKEFYYRLGTLLSLPQAAIETALTFGGNIKETGLYQSARDRLAALMIRLQEEDIRRGYRLPHVPPQYVRQKPMSAEEAQEVADTLLEISFRTGTDPLVYGAFWKMLNRFPALVRAIRAAPRRAPVMEIKPPPAVAAPTVAAPTTEAPSAVSRYEELLAARRQELLEKAPPLSTPEAPIAVTPRTVIPPGRAPSGRFTPRRTIEPVAILPLEGEPKIPTAKFPLQRTRTGQFAPRRVGTEYRPLEVGRPPEPAPYLNARPVFNENGEIVGWKAPGAEVIHPNPLQQALDPTDGPVSVWVEPLRPKALPAPRPYVRVSGPTVDIVYPKTAADVEKAAVQEIVHTTEPLGTTLLGEKLVQVPMLEAPSVFGKFLESRVNPKVAGRFSRVAAYLDRLGPPGQAIRLAMEGVYKTAAQVVGTQEALLMSRLGLNRFPRFTREEMLNMAEVMFEGKAPINDRVRIAVQTMLETYDQAREIILQNKIPGYIRREDLTKYAFQYGIDTSKAAPAKYIKEISPEGKVIETPRLFRLPAEEWVKTFKSGYHHRAFNWAKLRADYADPAKRTRILDHMIHLGQAKTRAEADGILSNLLSKWSEYVEHVIPTVERPLAHFQFPRVMPQLPKEYYLHPLHAWRKYFWDLGTVIGYQEHLGAQGEVIRAAWDALIRSDNPAFDKTFLADILAWFFGRKNDYAPYNPLLQVGTTTAVVLKMPLSTISQAGQFTHIYTLAGMKNLIRAFQEVRSASGFGYVDAVRAGAILSPTNVLREMNALSALTEGYLYRNKFLPLDQFLRAVGFQAGRYTFDDIVATAVRGRVPHTVRWIADRYRRSTQVDILAAVNRLSPDLKNAIAAAQDTRSLENVISQTLGNLRDDFGYWMANETQFRGTLLDKPLAAQYPLGKFVLAIRGFAYRQAAFVSHYLLGEAYRWISTGGQEGSIAPLIRFMAMGVPMGTAILAARTLVAALAVSGASLFMGPRSIRSWDDIKHVLEERFDKGYDVLGNSALILWEALNAIGGWGVITDAARSVWGSPIPFRAHAILSQIVGIPATSTVEFLAKVGAPGLFLLDWATSPAEEKAGKVFTEQFLKELRRAGEAIPGGVAGVGPALTEQLKLRSPESIKRRYRNLIKRNLIQGDWESAEYWSRKMLEATGDVPDPADIERWSTGRP